MSVVCHLDAVSFLPSQFGSLTFVFVMTDYLKEMDKKLQQERNRDRDLFRREARTVFFTLLHCFGFVVAVTFKIEMRLIMFSFLILYVYMCP